METLASLQHTRTRSNHQPALPLSYVYTHKLQLRTTKPALGNISLVAPRTQTTTTSTSVPWRHPYLPCDERRFVDQRKNPHCAKLPSTRTHRVVLHQHTTETNIDEQLFQHTHAVHLSLAQHTVHNDTNWPPQNCSTIAKKSKSCFWCHGNDWLDRSTTPIDVSLTSTETRQEANTHTQSDTHQTTRRQSH